MDKESWVLAGVLLFAGYGLARSLTACTPMIQPGQNLFLVGDSLAVGMNKYFRTMAANHGCGYASAVKGGTAAFQWIRSGYGLQGQFEAAKPNLVLVSLGTNDSVSSLTAEQHTIAIKKLLSMISSVGAEVYWILPPKLPWEQHFSDLVRAEGVPVFESSALDIPMGPDNIHPTGAGYAGWSGVVWKSITCGDNEPQQLSGPPPMIRRMRPHSKLVRQVKVGGVFTKRKR